MLASLDRSSSAGGEGIFLQCNRGALLSWWLHHIVPSFELPNFQTRWNRQMGVQVWVLCPCWLGSEPWWCWSPAPAQASLQHGNKSTFNFVPVVSRLLYILSQSMGVSRTFIKKTTKFHSNVTLCKLGLNLLLFLYCDYEQTPSLGWFLIFKAVFEWEVLNFKIRLSCCLVF